MNDHGREARDLQLLAGRDIKDGNPAGAREKLSRLVAIRRETGDRSGEAFALVALASVADSQVDAKDQLKRALDIAQAEGTRRHEIDAFEQIGLLAWKRGLKTAGLSLVALCGHLVGETGPRPSDGLLRRGIARMAAELGLSTAQLDDLTARAVEQHRSDRGRALVDAAFAGL